MTSRPGRHPATSSRRSTPRQARARRDATRRIYVLSDSTGNLARHMLTTFLTQFPPGAFDLQPRTFLQSDERLDQTLDEIAHHPGIVCHAVVAPRFKRTIERHCRRLKLPCRDLTGQFVKFLSEAAGIEPRDDQRLLHRVDEVYHRRIRALEFTLAHDDALALESIHEADIVLSGVSRTSKTPTSIYLAQQGYRVANVSLALGVDPPPQLLDLPPGRVVGLWIDADRLIEIRSRRQTEWHMPPTHYSDPEHVEREIAWSRRLFARQGWKTLDVTNRAIEESAARIVHLLRLPAPDEATAVDPNHAIAPSRVARPRPGPKSPRARRKAGTTEGS